MLGKKCWKLFIVMLSLYVLLYVLVSIMLIYQLTEDNISRWLVFLWVFMSCVLSVGVVVMGYKAKVGNYED